MGVFSPASASGVSAGDVLISSASNSTLTFSAANTEESFTIPAGTKACVVKVRGMTQVKYSFQSGESGTNYVTLRARSPHWVTSMAIGSSGLEVFVQSPRSGEVLEIVYYS